MWEGAASPPYASLVPVLRASDMAKQALGYLQTPGTVGNSGSAVHEGRCKLW